MAQSSIAFNKMTSLEQVDSLADCLAEILGQYDLVILDVQSINHECNSTYAVSCSGGEAFALRINVNSDRSLANLNAEIAWVNSIESVSTPKPVANKSGSFVTSGWHEDTNRNLNAVLYTWLKGVEPGDEATLEQIRAMGEAMARLHDEALGLALPTGAELPLLNDFFWGNPDMLTGDSSELSSQEKALVLGAKSRIEKVLEAKNSEDELRPIHADIHPFNVMWNEGNLSVFDFDDSGIGLPLQDIMTSLYYMDNAEQDEAFLEGYKSVRPLPSYTDEERKLLELQRRILLLNYLYETSNMEHREMIPGYQEETFRRITSLVS